MSLRKLYYKNGALYAKIHKEKREYFYEDGTKKTIETYQDGRLHGEILLYWPNGRCKRRSYFAQGKRHGIEEFWDETGRKLDAGKYHEGRPVGIHCRWNAEGELIAEETFDANP